MVQVANVPFDLSVLGPGRGTELTAPTPFPVARGRMLRSLAFQVSCKSSVRSLRQKARQVANPRPVEEFFGIKCPISAAGCPSRV